MEPSEYSTNVLSKILEILNETFEVCLSAGSAVAFRPRGINGVGMCIHLVEIDLQSESVRALNKNGSIATYLELVPFLQKVKNRLGKFFNIGFPVVTNVLAGNQRELRGV